MNLKMAHQPIALKRSIRKPRVFHIVEHLVKKSVIVALYLIVVISDYARRADIHRHGNKQRRNRNVNRAVAYLHIYIL